MDISAHRKVFSDQKKLKVDQRDKALVGNRKLNKEAKNGAWEIERERSVCKKNKVRKQGEENKEIKN